jgi:gliding motility-associated-like protein
MYEFTWNPLAANQGTFMVYKMPIGKYTIKVDVKGCITVSDEVEVDVIFCDVIIPNIITPNGDGKNDIFKIEKLEHYPKSSLKIYNRWGKKVYESDDYKNDWDGEGFADGVYFFILIVNDADISTSGEMTEHAGSLTIFRTK